MIFRFTLHAALSTAAASAAAAAAAAKLEGGGTKRSSQDSHEDRVSPESDYHSSSSQLLSSSSTLPSENNNNNVSFNKENEFLPKNNIVEEKNSAFRDPFVPQKLREKYRNAHSNENIQSLLLVNVADADADTDADIDPSSLKRDDLPTQARLRNPSSFRETKDDSTSIVVVDKEEIFDASNELGVLDSAKIQMKHNNNIEEEEEQQRDLADEMDLLSDCDGNYPLVSPDLNFRTLIKRCLYYKDNCPFNATLPLKCWDTSQVRTHDQ